MKRFIIFILIGSLFMILSGCSFSEEDAISTATIPNTMTPSLTTELATKSPSAIPTVSSVSPTKSPSAIPTVSPTKSPSAIPTVTQTTTPIATPTATPLPPGVVLHFLIDQQSHSSRGNLVQITLAVREALLSSDSLTFRIAFENDQEEWLSLRRDDLNREDFVLTDAEGNQYQAKTLSDNFKTVTTEGGLAPGGANVGLITFPMPSGSGPYQLNFVEKYGYPPLTVSFEDITATATQSPLSVPEGEYAIDMTLYSSEPVFAPFSLRTESVIISHDALTFNLAVVNSGYIDGYGIGYGLTGYDAWLIDGQRQQYTPISVSESLETNITPDGGLQINEAYYGSITFSRPDNLENLRFIVHRYSPLTIEFNPDGLSKAAVSSATGGPPPPTPTPDVAYYEVNDLLALQANALLVGDQQAYLATFDPALSPDQQTFFEQTTRLPLEDYQLTLKPTSRLIDNTLRRLRVEARFIVRDIGPQNPFIFNLLYDFKRENGNWYVTRAAYENKMPFWLHSDFILETTEHFYLFASPELSQQLPIFATEVESAYQSLSTQDLPLDKRYIGYFTATTSQFRRLGGLSGATGTASMHYSIEEDNFFVSNRLFLIDTQRAVENNIVSKRPLVIAHELVHVIMDPNERPVSPVWLIEGVANYYAGEYSQYPDDIYARLDSVSLERLTREHGGSVPSHVEYAFSGQLVAYLIETYGEETLLEFHHSYAALPFSEIERTSSKEVTTKAVERYFNTTLTDLEAAFKAWLSAPSERATALPTAESATATSGASPTAQPTAEKEVEKEVTPSVEPTSDGYEARIDLKTLSYVAVRNLDGNTTVPYEEVARIHDTQTPFTALARTPDGTWIYVRLQDGTLGWIASEFVVAAQPLEQLPLRTPAAPPEIRAHIDLKTFEFIYVRSGPSKSYREVSQLNSPNIYFMALGLSQDAAWVFVRLENGTLGWVSREFVVSDSALEPLPKRLP